MNKIPTLYHGTDARMVLMSEAERQKYKEVCTTAIRYLWTLYQSYHEKDMMLRCFMPALGYDDDHKQYLDLMSAMNCLGGKLRGNEFYQYDAFYLTRLRWRAENFAHKAFAGGEYGITAYRLYKAAKVIEFNNWNPDKEVTDALRRIECMAEEKPQPVLFCFDNLNPDNLMTEHAMPYTEDLYDVIDNVRYAGKIVLNINEAEWL